jgi:hypothetical protein
VKSDFALTFRQVRKQLTHIKRVDKKQIENGFTQHIDSNNYKDKNTKMMSKVRGPERAGERGIYVRKTGETRIPKTKKKLSDENPEVWGGKKEITKKAQQR